MERATVTSAGNAPGNARLTLVAKKRLHTADSGVSGPREYVQRRELVCGAVERKYTRYRHDSRACARVLGNGWSFVGDHARVVVETAPATQSKRERKTW